MGWGGAVQKSWRRGYNGVRAHQGQLARERGGTALRGEGGMFSLQGMLSLKGGWGRPLCICICFMSLKTAVRFAEHPGGLPSCRMGRSAGWGRLQKQKASLHSLSLSLSLTKDARELGRGARGLAEQDRKLCVRSLHLRWGRGLEQGRGGRGLEGGGRDGSACI